MEKFPGQSNSNFHWNQGNELQTKPLSTLMNRGFILNLFLRGTNRMKVIYNLFEIWNVVAFHLTNMMMMIDWIPDQL